MRTTHGRKQSSMFFRMLVRAAMLRKRSAASALIATVVAATAATAMLNLFVDVQAKLRKSFVILGRTLLSKQKVGRVSRRKLCTKSNLR